MSGLRRICRMYGSIRVNGITHVWDYVADEPVLEKDMPHGSERRRASEKRWAELIAEQKAKETQDGR